MVSLQYCLVSIFYFHQLIPCDVLIVLAFHRSSLNFLKFLLYPILSLFRIKNPLFLLLFWFLFIFFWWRWWRWSSNSHIVRWKETLLISFFNWMPKPPSILKSFLYNNFLPFLKCSILNFIIVW